MIGSVAAVWHSSKLGERDDAPSYGWKPVVMAALPQGLAANVLSSLAGFLSCFLSCIVCVGIAFFF